MTVSELWTGRCQSCGRDFTVKMCEGATEAQATKALEAAHEEQNRDATAFRCDMGPFITSASNLTRPEHPCALREW